jgi:hypothetical protein
MFDRKAFSEVEAALQRQPCVALLGPRQVGKTTLAHTVAEKRPSIYLDLEAAEDRAKLQDPRGFFTAYDDRLIILDEIHRMPGIFPELRGVIDDYRRRGMRTGKFLVLGSASLDLLRQSGETLAGRIAYIDMGPLTITEAGKNPEEARRLWVRGGFPDSLLAKTDAGSLLWRRDLVRTYLEREVAAFGFRLPAEHLRRLWTMLAHSQGGMLNASQFAGALSISPQTTTRYVDLLCDLLLVRRLEPFHANLGKRLVKSPRLYVRDTGLLHALLGLADYEALAGHPVFGASYETFVIENILAHTPTRRGAWFYRTAAGAEVDLLIERESGERIAVEVKAGRAPKVGRGFHEAIADLKPARAYIVHAGEDAWPLGGGVVATSLPRLLADLAIA